MKKNGFTLIELLAALTLMAILATLVINFSIKKLNEAKEKSRETMITSIEMAAENYAINFGDENESFKNNDFMFVKLETLVSKELLTNNLIDETTNKPLPLDDTVYVTINNLSKIRAYYDINQKNNPRLTLNGSYNMYLKKGSTFTDPGIQAIDSTGADVTSQIQTAGTVDANTKGTYVITYTYLNSKITRNVVVY